MAGKTNDVTEWLLEGDPVIRFQVMRDLLGDPEEVWQAERQRTLTTGWGAAFLDALQPDGSWPEGRWTGAVWTLPLLIDCGLPPEHPRLREAARKLLAQRLPPEKASDEKWLLTRNDLCHLGFLLRVGAYFLGPEERLTQLVQTLLKVPMADGGWNCRKRSFPHTHHGSFHTTFNVLEGLTIAADAGIIDGGAFRAAEAKALEFMLMHKMYKSDKTGEVIDQRFINLTFPTAWHYNVLRGLDYMHSRPQIADPRLDDAIAWLKSRRKDNGHWPVEKRIPGAVLFDMDKFGGDSRWITLKALRILRAREAAGAKT